MSGDVLLRGFGCSGFRSLAGDEIQRIRPLGKIHLIAGQNNAGKSNVLRAAQRFLPTLAAEPTVIPFSTLDRPSSHDTQAAHVLRLAIGHKITEGDLIRAVRPIDPLSETVRVKPEALLGLLQYTSLRPDEDGLSWFELEVATNDAQTAATSWSPSNNQIEEVASVELPDGYAGPAVASLTESLTGYRFSADGQPAAMLLEHLVGACRIGSLVPPIATIGAFRQITPSLVHPPSPDHDGAGLIERLAELQGPESSKLSDLTRFSAINRFVQSVLEDATAQLLVTHNKAELLVRHHDEYLPLENYGTGIHQVVILAAAATVLEGHLVCIEEPEIHLHPALQRKLLKYLDEETNNQYLIATHSPHLLDAARASISAVSLINGETRIAPAIEPDEIARLSADLGLRASDLVQSNAMIWVEGPSDRTYILHWLSLVAPNLVEGAHFSIMFYGGSLLRHLDPDDPSVEDFISLPRINRNFAVVIDSDKRQPDAALNDTKLRVIDGIDAKPELSAVWVTEGYTIENYVPAATLTAAVNAVHPTKKCTWTGDTLVNPLGKDYVASANGADDSSAVRIDKAAVARIVVNNWPVDEWPLDLKTRVQEIAEFIRAANSR